MVKMSKPVLTGIPVPVERLGYSLMKLSLNKVVIKLPIASPIIK